MNNKKTITLWCAMNKNGTIAMHLEEPHRNNNAWVSNMPFCNYIVYNNMLDLFEKTNYNWTNDPQVFVINV